MKKSLLLCASALMATSSAFAAVQDGQTYAPSTKDGVTITCQNIWILDRGHDKAAFEATTLGNADLGAKNFRSATLSNGVVYVAGWPAGNATLLKFDAATGAQIGQAMALTLNGEPHTGSLAANNILADSFGNLIVMDGLLPQSEVSEEKPLHKAKVYSLNAETGELAVLAELELEHNARIDYFDVIGDVTGANADCIIMAAASGDAGWVYRWKLAKGTNEWKGDFEGAAAFEIKDFYINVPEKGAITAWGVAPAVKIVRGEGDAEFAGELFYVDGFNGAPILYDNYGGVVDSFESAIDLAPQTGANGIAEISLKGRNFIAFANNQHTGSNGGNEISFCEVGADMSLGSMERIWYIPANGMNPELVSDGGARFHAIYTQPITDKAGKEGCYLLTYKCFAGVGIYLLAEEGFQLETGAVEGVEANNANVVVANGMISVNEAASIEVYNMAGQKVVEANASQVAAPAAGAYIVKANVNGNAVVGKVIL